MIDSDKLTSTAVEVLLGRTAGDDPELAARLKKEIDSIVAKGGIPDLAAEWPNLPDENDEHEEESPNGGSVPPSPFRDRKSLLFSTKGRGTCKQGERADLTNCTPATKEPTQQKPPSREDYLSQGQRVVRTTSRTAGGKIDTSASPEKAGQIQASGEEAASLAVQNFNDAVELAYQVRDDPAWQDPEKVMQRADKINQLVNKGIVKEGVLERTSDSRKFPYTKVEDLPLARKQFAEELVNRLNDSGADPIETAAWIEWRVNPTDHFWADGVGKTSKILAAIPLMRAGLPLPNYPPPEEFFKHGNTKRRDPKQGADSYLDEEWDGFLEHYRSFAPKQEKQKERNHIAAKQLDNFLKMGVALGTDGVYNFSKGAKYKTPLEYVLDKGKPFLGSPLSEGVEKGRPHLCFENATRLVLENDGWKYAEGFAMRDSLLPVLHAWAVTPKGKVVDNTFPDPENSAYFGIVYDRNKYLKHILKKKYYGLLGGRDKDAVQILQRGGL